MGPKRLELLRELLPKAKIIAILVNPNYPDPESKFDMQATERRRRPLANQFGYVGAFGCRQQIYSILRCNQRDLLFKRGDPFLKHRNLVIDQTGNEGPEFVAGSVATSAANVVATLNAYGLATLCSMRRRDSESWILRSAF